MEAALPILVQALVAGAAAALKPTAGQAVQDAYNGLKTLIAQKYARVSDPIQQLEQKPESAMRQGVVQEELEETGAAADEEVLREAERLLEAVKSEAPDVARTVGVSMEDIEAASIRLKDIIATGAGSTGVRMNKVRATGDIDIQGVRAGGSSDSDPKK